MKVKDLLSALKNLDENSEIYFCPSNSHYVEDFSERIESDVEVRKFWGPDKNAAVIFSSEQVGAI